MPPQRPAANNPAEAVAPNVTSPGVTDFIGFYDTAATDWQGIEPAIDGLDAEQAKTERKRAKHSREALNEFLLSSLQMQHLVVLAGSGTSLGPVNGPSMASLWDDCVY